MPPITASPPSEAENRRFYATARYILKTRDGSNRPHSRRSQASGASSEAVIRTALAGILYILEDLVAAPIADGRLTRLLESWCEPFAGYHLYYPDRRGTTALELFKETLRASRVL